MVTLLGRGYIDILYCHKHDCLLTYDCSAERVFTIDDQLDDYTILKRFRGHEFVGRTMKFNNPNDQEHLFLNDGQEITVLTDFEHTGYYKSFNLKNITDYQIMDFTVFEDNNLLVLDERGKVTIYKVFYFDLWYEEVTHLQLGIDADEITTSIAICPRNQYIAVSISLKDGFHQNWLVVLHLDDSESEVRLVLEDIKENKTKEEDSIYFALSIPFYKDDFPVILGSEFGSENMLNAFYFNGKKIQEFKHPYWEFLSGHNYRFVKREEKLWIVDSNGIMKKIFLDKRGTNCKVI